MLSKPTNVISTAVNGGNEPLLRPEVSGLRRAGGEI